METYAEAMSASITERGKLGLFWLLAAGALALAHSTGCSSGDGSPSDAPAPDAGAEVEETSCTPHTCNIGYFMGGKGSCHEYCKNPYYRFYNWPCLNIPSKSCHCGSSSCVDRDDADITACSRQNCLLFNWQSCHTLCNWETTGTVPCSPPLDAWHCDCSVRGTESEWLCSWGAVPADKPRNPEWSLPCGLWCAFKDDSKWTNCEEWCSTKTTTPTTAPTCHNSLGTGRKPYECHCENTKPVCKLGS